MSDVKRQEKLQDAIGLIGDDLIIGAKKKNRIIKLSHKTKALIAAVLVLVLVAASIIYPRRYFFVYGEYVIEAAEYPMLWGERYEQYAERVGAYKPAAAEVEAFYRASITEFLSNSNGRNVTYSPVNVTIAMSMLAEITDGESRSQILDTLGVADIETLREKISDIWNANYAKGKNTCVLANSIWLDKDVSYNKEVLSILADKYYASSFYGQMGDKKYTEALRAWLNEQSDGLLEEANKDLELDSDMIVMLAATLNFDDDWKEKFDSDKTKSGVFHSISGDITCQFMRGEEDGSYYEGEQFVAASRPFKSGASMWFLLPDEDISVDELLQNEQALNFIVNSDKDKGQDAEINLLLPKYDICSELDLAEGLRNLGIKDVFLPDEADFSPLLGNDGGYAVDTVEHSVRVIVDEDGAKAVAQTTVSVKNEGVPKTVTVKLDRPFIFVIQSEAGAPLFVGVVNQPK